MPRSARPNPRKVTVADIARAAGVSPATVSLVLGSSPLVAARTRERVQAELLRQGYVYNRAAANLRRGTSSAVALVLNDLSNPFFAEFAAGVDEALAAAGCVTLLGSTGENPERQDQVLASLLEHAPAGIILSPAEGSDGATVARRVGASLPVLVFNRTLDGPGWDVLALDNRRGARLATEHLIALGHRRIAFYGGHAGSSSCAQRRAGYLDALQAADLAPNPAWLIETAPSRIAAARDAAALFTRSRGPTAAVCYNDAVALGLQLGLSALGRSPGRDFAVTGFDDIPEAAVSLPPLTTIGTDPRERGRQAARRVLARARDPSVPPRRTTAAVKLVVRESTAPPPKEKKR